MRRPSLKRALLVYAPIALSLVILAGLVYPNLHEFLVTVRTARPKPLFFSFFFSAVSYVFIGLSLWEVLKILGHRLRLREAVGIAFVSTTVNYFVSSAGVSGFATRAHLLSKRGVPYGICVTSSVVITVFIYLVLAIIIAEGMLLQLFKASTSGVSVFQDVGGILAVLTFAFSLGVLFFHHELRSAWARKLYHAANWFSYLFSKKTIPEETFRQFESQLSKGIHTIQAKRYELPMVLAYVCLDWVCNILILHYAFRAVGAHLHTSTLIIGFALGQLMTIIPILPGGMGAMEAAMTAAFSGMGVPVGQALTASLVFRLFYYLVPAFASVAIYWLLKTSEPPAPQAAAHHGHRRAH